MCAELREVTLEEALDVLNNPTEEEFAQAKNFVRLMVGGVPDESESQNKATEARDLVIKVHEATSHKEYFVKNYILKEMSCIPGSKQNEGSDKKPSKLDNFRKAILEYPFLFEFDYMRQGFTRLVLDVSKYTALVEKHGSDVLGGTLDQLPNVFDTRKLLAGEVVVDLDDHADWTEELTKVVVPTQMADHDVAGQLVEIVYNVHDVQNHLRGKRHTPELRMVRAYLH